MKKQEQWISKRPPVGLFDLLGLEQWLGEMASQGLFLVKMGPFRCFFRPDTPRPGRRYHLCPTKDQIRSPDPELLELYAHSGWQYVTAGGPSYLHFYLFCTDDPAAPAPFNDPDSFLQALRYPVNSLLLSVLCGFILLLHYTWRVNSLSGLALSSPNQIAAAQFLVLLWLLITSSRGLDLTAALLLRHSLRHHRSIRPGLPRLLRRMKQGFWALSCGLFLLPASLPPLPYRRPSL